MQWHSWDHLARFLDPSLAPIALATTRCTCSHGAPQLLDAGCYTPAAFEMIASLLGECNSISARDIPKAIEIFYTKLLHALPPKQEVTHPTCFAALVTKKLLIDQKVAEAMSMAKELTLGVDGHTYEDRHVTGLHFQWLDATDQVQRSPGILVEAKGGGQETLNTVLKVIEYYKKIQAMMQLPLITLSKFSAIVYDTTSENTGKHSGFGALFEKARQQEWSALPDPKSSLTPLTKKGCIDHIQNLVFVAVERAIY
jgi:hypothetical protein